MVQLKVSQRIFENIIECYRKDKSLNTRYRNLGIKARMLTNRPTDPFCETKSKYGNVQPLLSQYAFLIHLGAKFVESVKSAVPFLSIKLLMALLIRDAKEFGSIFN